MELFKPCIWIRAALLSVPLLVGQIAVSQLQTDVGVTPLSSAIAAQEKKKDARKTRRTPALRNKVYEKLAEAQAAAEEKDLAKAEKILNGMIASGGKRALNSYELANVYNLYAFIYYLREDYANALKAYENVVAQPDIPIAMEVNTKFTIAQLYFVQEQWQKGINALLDWFRATESPNANAYVLLAQGYYQIKDYDKALFNVEKAISIYKENPKSSTGYSFPTCTASNKKRASNCQLWKLPMCRVCWIEVLSR